MTAIYEKALRPLLFLQEPEKAHDSAMIWMKLLGSMSPLCRALESYNLLKAPEPIELFGLEFPNAVGLAAGFDKNAECIKAISAFGFGHIEVGTVTRHRQPGNARPRLFRYADQEAIINRMGFNNDGAEQVATRLAKLPKRKHRRVPVGINIGKTRVVPLEEAVDDYLGSFNLLADYADYFAINVSSPNTPELRKLQGRDFLPSLLETLMHANRERARKMGTEPIPLLLKIAPDLSYREIDDILEALFAAECDGVIATNTTIQRTGTMLGVEESGGLSGRPLRKHSLDVVKYVSRATNRKLPIIGVGGIFDPISAGEMMDAGASLIQIYTSFIYRGPFVAKELARSLMWRYRDWV